MILSLGLVVGSSVLTTLWHHWIHRHREVRSHRALCNHVWGDVTEVGAGSHRFGEFYIRWCMACGEQMHANADGSKYVPLKDRRDDN